MRKGPVPIDILLIEDNQGDVRLLQEADPGARLHVVTDGAEAMDFPGYQGKYLAAPRPNPILLDLNLPELHGHEVLSRVKGNPNLQTIPVIVLTSSDAESDVVTSYQQKANCYLRKPIELKGFEQLVVSLNDFWLNRDSLVARGQVMGPI
jgi:chemotaxis family two-component system response regulator Rcp1